ncbi:spermatogenesis-associated protein 6-like isoform X3 [Saccostrea echinata]|uniref:spermatogenesis-associated protein 6-like isoform X3 n=1 Tax=Saccostrea echinata TaxID=191078 RepID=UPI002A832068|nr:spermatogenesis-associated protein 6-like isoform X3 [Saccostrea echinata]
MPRRALRCVVDLKLRAVTAPGVWLPSREDVYVSISLFGQYKNTCLLESVFPLIIREDFTFEKTYYTALDPSEVVDYLEDELIVFELLQLSEFGGANRLASYSSSARDFLYPAPSLSPCYASGAREILFHRSIDFPGISPKLEFVSITNIKESLSPELDALEDSLREERRSRRRSRSRSRSRPTSRPSSRASMRSPSPAARWKSDDVYVPKLNSTEGRPPFVVRHLEKSLIGRIPGSGDGLKAKTKKKVKRGRSRSRSRSVSAMSDSALHASVSSLPENRCCVCSTYKKHMGRRYWGHTLNYHPTGLTPKTYNVRRHSPKVPLNPRKHSPRVPLSPRKHSPRGSESPLGSSPGKPLSPHRHSPRKCLFQTSSLDGDDPLPRASPRQFLSDDEDAEVAALTGSVDDLRLSRRSRSPSPLLYRPSLRERYGLRPLTPTEKLDLDLRVEQALRRSRSRERLARLELERSRSRSRERLARLEIELAEKRRERLAREELEESLRRARASPTRVHLDDGTYWSERAAKFQGKSHRQVFNDSLSKLYSKMYRGALRAGPV